MRLYHQFDNVIYVVWYSFKTGSVKTIQLKTDQRIDVSALKLRSVIKRQFIVRNCFGLAILLMIIGSLIHVPNDLHLFFFCSEPFTNPIFWTKGQGRIQMELLVSRINSFFFFFGEFSEKKSPVGRKNSAIFPKACIFYRCFTHTYTQISKSFVLLLILFPYIYIYNKILIKIVQGTVKGLIN